MVEIEVRCRALTVADGGQVSQQLGIQLDLTDGLKRKPYLKGL